MKCIHSPSPTLLVGSSGFESFSDVLRLYTSYKRRLCSLLRPRYWWAQVDSNHRPCAYQAHALTTWAMSPFLCTLVEMKGFEPLTPCLQGRCSPNWATPPYLCTFGPRVFSRFSDLFFLFAFHRPLGQWKPNNKLLYLTLFYYSSFVVILFSLSRPLNHLP